MEISFPKTEVMTLSTERACNVALQVKGLKVVTEFTHLGPILNGQSDLEAAVRIKCTKASLAVLKMRPVLVSSLLTMRIKYQLTGMCVRPILLYRLENAITREQDVEKKALFSTKPVVWFLSHAARNTHS